MTNEYICKTAGLLGFQFRAMDESRAQGPHRDQTHDVSLTNTGHSVAELTVANVTEAPTETLSPHLRAVGASLPHRLASVLWL